MSASQIQTFLNSKVPTCAAGYTCLKSYTENGRTAAQMISEVSSAYRINPQVLIVLLQKEQGLITATAPTATQYRTATGYACPDNAACDSKYFGLMNQLRWSATMFRAIMDASPTWYTPYILGNNRVYFHPGPYDNANKRWYGRFGTQRDIEFCGSTTVNIQNRATQALYSYTPYQPNSAALSAGYGTGDTCSSYGNRNFYMFFRDWFGSSYGPAAFTATGSNTIYMPIEGYKVAVPHMAILQDFGISPDAIKTVGQDYIDSFKNPSGGISSNVNHVIKSPYDNDEDGGSIYVVALGKRYQIQTMAQFFSLGFKESEISYLPLSYVLSVPSSGMLPNFLTSPYGNVFELSDNQKHLLFDYSTYIERNPSDKVGAFSYYLIDRIPSGNPVSTKPILVKRASGEEAFLYQNNSYYTIPDYETLKCWGLDSYLNLPTYRVSPMSYIASIETGQQLSCSIKSTDTTYSLSENKRLRVPSSIGVIGSDIDSQLTALSNKLPLRDSPLNKYVKTRTDQAVWHLENGVRKVIPTYNQLKKHGVADSQIDTIDSKTLSGLSYGGIKLQSGSVVKTKNDATVYLLAGTERIAYPTSSLFLAHGNDWSDIEEYSDTDLANYPYSGKQAAYIVADSEGSSLILNAKECFILTSTHLASYPSLRASAESLVLRDVPQITSSKCKTATNFVKAPTDSLVYVLENGKRSPILTFSALLRKNGGTEPQVMTIDEAKISSLPIGESIK